jgi:hypothetical protein
MSCVIRRAGAAVLLLTGMVLAWGVASADAAVVRDGHARFEVLSPTLIRLEYADDDRFEDGATMTAVNRVFPPARFETSVRGGTLIIRTPAMTLTYQRGSGPFTQRNVSVELAGGGTVQPSWQPDSNPQNLGGWRRALDDEQGPVPLHDGVLSRAGWYLLDDSQTALLTASGFAPRPAHSGAYQDGYLFAYGHDYMRALADLRELTGPAPLLPRKALGVWFSRYYAYNADDYQALLGQFRAAGVPLDTLSVDTDWKRESNPIFAPVASTAAGGSPTQPYSWDGWEWDTSLFPDPRAFLSWAHAQGLAVALNIHPSINGDDPQFKATNARAGGLSKDGGTCRVLVATPAGCYVFNWADARQLDAYLALHAPLESDGVDLWWLDWCCDGSSAQAPGLSADTWINSRYAERSAARGSRWPVLSRIGASFQGPGTDGDAGEGDGGAGAFAEHRYAIHFTGDTCATWPMLAFEPQFTTEEGNAGLPYVSHDIGSFNGPPIAGNCTDNPGSKLANDIYVRWVQMGTFQPLDRLHSNHGARLPWEYPEPARTIAADFLRLREALVPYLYTLARDAYDSGLPLTRALYLQWPDLADAYAHPSEYTLGSDMLVAPVTAPGDPAAQTVWIPPGTWTDYFTGARLSGPKTVRLDVPLGRYPVFVRAGAIVPTQPPGLATTTAGPQDPLVLTTWGGGRDSFDLYDDQGQGLAYRSGAYTTTHIASDTATARCSSLTIGPARGSFPGAPRTRSWQVRFVGVAEPLRVTVGGRALGRSRWTYDTATRTLTIATPELPTRSAASVAATAPGAICGCPAPLRLRVRAPRHARIVRVDVYVATRRAHGRLVYRHVLRVRHRPVRAVTVGSPPAGAFTLKVVARDAHGRRWTTVRRYGACGRR